MPDHSLFICPHCHTPQKSRTDAARRWWHRFFPGRLPARPGQTCCVSCGEKLQAAQGRFEGHPIPSDQPGLLAVRCVHCQAPTNYRPAHSGRCIRCASCSEPLTLP